MIKTKLVNLPIDLAEQERIMTFLSTTLRFATALDLYSSNRKKEDDFNDILALELDILRKEVQLVLFKEVYNKDEEDFYRKLLEGNDEKDQQEKLAYQQKLYDELQNVNREVLNYRKEHGHIAQVDNLFLIDADMSYLMFLSLAVGKRQAASFLSDNFDKGYGVAKNDFLACLCKAMCCKTTDTNITIKINNNNILNKAKKLADECVVQIQRNTMELGEKSVTYPEHQQPLLGRQHDDSIKAIRTGVLYCNFLDRAQHCRIRLYLSWHSYDMSC